MSSVDETFMRQALDLAAGGRGRVEPNPMVGCVIVRDGEILGQGRHEAFGGPHAEVNALSDCRERGNESAGATFYVTLEPCSHSGKTPPCADALIAAGAARVVVAMEDPDDRVAGRGLQRIADAGIDVATGICEADARRLLREYVKLRTQVRPWVIAKWAQTTDGYLALPPEQGRWVSGPESLARVHELRAVLDGISVGVETVLADDPELTNRSGSGKTPTRVVLDGRLRTPADCRLLRTADQAAVLVATTTEALQDRPAQADALRSAGAEVLGLPPGPGGTGVDLASLLDELGRRQWTRLLVEGGPTVLASLLQAGLADELWAFVAPKTVVEAPTDLPRFALDDVPSRLYAQVSSESIGADTLHILEKRPG